MRIFITGRNGFIATHLINHLLNKNYIVESSVREDNIESKLTMFNPDIIIHLAAETVNESEMINANILLTYNILEYVKTHPIKKLLVIGSSSEYGRKNKPIQENDILEPTNIYEATKASASLLARAYSYEFSIPITIIRPFSVYGFGEKPNKLIARLLNNNLSYINNANHDWIYINDFIDALIIIMNFNETSLFNIVNIGSGVQYTNKEILEIAQKITKYEYKYIINNTGKIYDSNYWLCDTTILNNKYKFYPKYNIYDGIQEYYTLFKNSLITEHT